MIPRNLELHFLVISLNLFWLSYRVTARFKVGFLTSCSLFGGITENKRKIYFRVCPVLESVFEIQLRKSEFAKLTYINEHILDSSLDFICDSELRNSISELK